MDSPCVTDMGNEKATNETFTDNWVHTGDEGVFREIDGQYWLFIVDRIKEYILVVLPRVQFLISSLQVDQSEGQPGRCTSSFKSKAIVETSTDPLSLSLPSSKVSFSVMTT